MNYALTGILLAIGALLLTIAIRSLHQQRLKERYALLFVGLGLPFLALAVRPETVGEIGKALKIEYTTVLLICITTFFLLLNFKLLSIVSVQDRKITTLTQDLGILMARQKRCDQSKNA